MCMLCLQLSKKDFETNLHCVISNNVENIRSSFCCVWCYDDGVESAFVKSPGSVRRASLSCKQHPWVFELLWLQYVTWELKMVTV